jgi:hypothetical protein
MTGPAQLPALKIRRGFADYLNMVQWESIVVTVPINRDLQSVLNELGQQGWEPVQILPTPGATKSIISAAIGGKCVIVAKRPKAHSHTLAPPRVA